MRSGASSFCPRRFFAPETGGRTAPPAETTRTIPFTREAIAAAVRDLSPRAISEAIANTRDIADLLGRLETGVRKRYLADLTISPIIWTLPQELAARLHPIFQAKKMNAAEKAAVFDFLDKRRISAVEKGCIMLLALTQAVEPAGYEEALYEAIEVAAIFVKEHNYPSSRIERTGGRETIIEEDGSLLVGVLLRQQP